MADTKYIYEPNKDCDFSNYTNEHRTPDSAIAIYWDEANLASGGVRNAEFLYGIGNFTKDLATANVNINLSADDVKLSEDKKSYVNDGVITVHAEIDNTVDGAKDIIKPMVDIALEDGLTLVKGKKMEEFEIIPQGEIKKLSWKVKAKNQSVIASKELVVSLINADS
ncbi:MAG: hypothetical protein RR145_04305, partial [Oscillospiraceae bacterium]